MLCFWLAYILTRPLGANIGVYLAAPRSEGGLGLGTFGTSLLFLGIIVVVVAYLTVTDRDRTERVRMVEAEAELGRGMPGTSVSVPDALRPERGSTVAP